MSLGNSGRDPGWNDPPTFTYEQAAAIQATAEKKKTFLTKRVAFPCASPPISGGMDPTKPPVRNETVNPPPIGFPPSTKLPPVENNIHNEIDSTLMTDCSEENQLQAVIDNLKTFHSFDEDDDISRRFGIMKDMWAEGKLGFVVQRKILDLSEALRTGNVEGADRIQKALMIDHGAVCSSWMSAIRHIINNQRATESNDLNDPNA